MTTTPDRIMLTLILAAIGLLVGFGVGERLDPPPRLCGSPTEGEWEPIGTYVLTRQIRGDDGVYRPETINKIEYACVVEP